MSSSLPRLEFPAPPTTVTLRHDSHRIVTGDGMVLISLDRVQYTLNGLV